MKFSTILKRMTGWYESGKCVYLKSPPGRGKTSVLASAPAMIGAKLGKNLGLVIINGPLLTPADSIGYLIPKAVGDHVESIYTEPFWYRTREGKRLDEYDGGIIVVDEMDKADVDVKKVIGEAALSGRLGPHVLPAGWIVWMAGNRQKDRSGSTKELDHLINRRMEIDVTDDVESWNDFALKHGVSGISMAFANQNLQIVFSEGVPEKQGPWCTPRSLVEADDYMRVLARDNGGVIPNDPETLEEISGMIGEAAAAQLFAFIKIAEKMPKYEDIVKDPAGSKLPQQPDEQMLVCYTLAGRTDKADVAPVVQYMERMPKEFGVVFAKALVNRDHMLVVHPAIHAWLSRNASLMAALSAYR